MKIAVMKKLAPILGEGIFIKLAEDQGASNSYYFWELIVYIRKVLIIVVVIFGNRGSINEGFQ